jgi:aminoglycoside phosphotransferase (APT) family kinase protein
MSAESNPTVAVRKGEELNAAAVDAILKDLLPDLMGEPVITQYPSGASNITYAVDYPNRRMVLRRPPAGDKPKSGHDMHREYRVMTALKGHIPVPHTLYYTDDAAHIGAEFYVMDRNEGHLIHTEIPKDWNWGEGEARQLCENFFQTLVDMHSVDYEAVGLGDFGKPEGYVSRQILGWNRRWEKAWTEDLETFEDVQTWLVDHMPAAERGAAIIHGDYRIDNCILRADDPTQIEAILDWEISALGDPMMDLGNTLAYWIQADDPDFMKLTVRQPSMVKGMMTRQEILDFYAAKTGADVSGFQFYYVYGIWRLAVIIQQIYARFYRGQNDNPRFKDYGQMAAALGNLARYKIKTGTL